MWNTFSLARQVWEGRLASCEPTLEWKTAGRPTRTVRRCVGSACREWLTWMRRAHRVGSGPWLLHSATFFEQHCHPPRSRPPYPVRSMHGPLAPPPQCTLTRYGSPPSRLAARRQERLPWILWGGSPLGTAVLSRIRLCPGAGPPYAIPTRGPPNGWCSAPRMDTIWEKSPAYEHPPPPCSNDTRPRASSARGPPACRLAGVTARTGGAARPARAGRARRTVRQPPPISPRARAHDTVRVRPRPRGPSAAPLRSRHRASTGGYPQSFLVMDPVRRVGKNASPSPVPHTGSVAAAQPPRGCSAAKMAAPTPARCVSSPGAAGCLHAAV